jgi:surface protein
MMSSHPTHLHDHHISWPTETLSRLLHFLSVQCDAQAQRVWHQLAFLVCKGKNELAKFARIMPRPIVLRIEIKETSYVFKVPFMQATVVCVDVDWGDGHVDELREIGIGYIEHTFVDPGEYAVRIFPATVAPQPHLAVSLDHLGCLPGIDTTSWHYPLREIISLGRCGLRSLSFLFSQSSLEVENLKELRTEGIADMSGMFCSARDFNQPIGGWDTRSVTNMDSMFYGAAEFNQPIGKWVVSNVVVMRSMFAHAAKFNHPIGDWSVSNVTDMNRMFLHASSFNHPIGKWDVRNVTNMKEMFSAAYSFSCPLGDWNVAKVKNMSQMFKNARSFDQPIGRWNVSSVTNMSFMFQEALSFNQPICDWNVLNVLDFRYMFFYAIAFRQSLDKWVFGPHAEVDNIFSSRN